MNALVVLGAGGHAKVVADVAGRLGHVVAAYVDEGDSSTGSKVHGVPVLGSLDEVPGLPVALGIGENRARLTRYEHLIHVGRQIVTLVHPHAVLASTVTLGTGTVVMAGVVINSDTQVGAAAVLNTSSSVDHDCILGDGAHLAPGTHLAGGVIIGTGAFLGVGTSVVPCRAIGAWAVCGAGSVVVDNVDAGRTVKGAPAR